MPSKFEPGGIVQHEFFSGETPVIAYKTGGLEDTIEEFENGKGWGFFFIDYNEAGLEKAIMRALKVYKNKEQYIIMRENALKACID